MFCLVWDYSCSKLKDKTLKQNALLKSYKNEIKILANPGLAQSGFEQPSPGGRFSKAPETFRARKAIAKFRTLRLQSCFILIF